MSRERLQRALEAIDARNADDPNTLVVRGEERPKELAHAELASEWIARLVDEPSEALELAARAHHLRRWAIPRSDHPKGKVGYHAWRKALQQLHADEARAILARCGYDEAVQQRTADLIQKMGLRPGNTTDPEVQALEDALCLVFLETQLTYTAGLLDDEERAVEVLRKAARKMSPRALELAMELPLLDEERALVRRALE